MQFAFSSLLHSPNYPLAHNPHSLEDCVERVILFAALAWPRSRPLISLSPDS
jgi:hypothetical protein